MISSSRSAAQDFPLREWPRPLLDLACDLCPRRAQYLKATLISRFGGDVLLSDLRYKIAHCVCKHASAQACGMYYADLRDYRRRDLGER
jgi:hypothetical protein